jgi:predicted peptidase
MGGHGIFRYLMEDHEYFAAAIPTAGAGLKKTSFFIEAETLKDFPIWAFHGEKDTVSPYAKGQSLFKDFQKVGGLMKFTTLKDQAHKVPSAFLSQKSSHITHFSSDRCDKEQDALKWLFSQKNQ